LLKASVPNLEKWLGLKYVEYFLHWLSLTAGNEKNALDKSLGGSKDQLNNNKVSLPTFLSLT
jgi:hypothetical protein